MKCIYIDPPYNTGSEGWVYNDNVISPEIRRWLGEVVGREGETLDRHDRWLCMMADKRIARVLRNDPATGVMRHADAGYDTAIECGREQGLKLPMV